MFYKNDENREIKIAIWIYFWLWLFEGALRKWFLPSLSNPLLIVRDPIALYILYKALVGRISFINNYILIGCFTTFLSIVFALLIGHQNLWVALFGARIMLIHFPLIFIIGEVFTKSDVDKFGQIMLFLLPWMTILISFQFYSPQSAWINRGLGGNLDGAGFSGAMGYFRPPGTFSFITGVQMFYPLGAVFVFYYWLSNVKCNKVLLITASLSLAVALPISISRTAVFWVLFIAIMSVIGIVVMGRKRAVGSFIKFAIIGVLILILLQYTEIYQLGSEVFSARLKNANKGGAVTLKESIGDRMIENLIGPLFKLSAYDLIIGNLGMGTNAGTRLLGKTGYLIGEIELERLFGERGLILGLIMYVLRVFLVLKFMFLAFLKLNEKLLLPWLLSGIIFFIMIRGHWGQPTALGFSVITCGLLISLLKRKNLIKVKDE